MPEIKFTLDVTAQCDKQLEKYCADFLTGRGFYIVAPGKPWERVTTFCKRVGIHSHKLAELVERHEARGGQPVRLDRRGVSRRVMAMQVNPEFENFCRATKR